MPDFWSKVVAPTVSGGVETDPLRRLAADERLSKARAAGNYRYLAKLKIGDALSQALGSVTYFTDYVLYHPAKRVFAKFSRTYPHIGVALDIVPTGAYTRLSFPGMEKHKRDVAAANGYRWIALLEGTKFETDLGDPVDMMREHLAACLRAA